MKRIALSLAIVSVLFFATAGMDSHAQQQVDPHRPPCIDASCHKIRTYLKKHYCGESPAGNGPDDGCDVRDARRHNTNFKAVADYECSWNEQKDDSECTQYGHVAPDVKEPLVRELHQLGAPRNLQGDTFFTIWKSPKVEWTLAQAYYSHRVGGDVELCEVIELINQNAKPTIIRKLPFTKTDADVPAITDWTFLDLADTRGNGNVDVILLGGAYEDHWLEVISVQDGSVKTIFSGLGYYL